MDLNFGPEYKAFKKEVEAFCIKWKGVSFKNESKSALLDLAGPISEKSGKISQDQNGKLYLLKMDILQDLFLKSMGVMVLKVML